MAKPIRGGKNNPGAGVTFSAKGELTLPNGSKIEFDGDLNYGKKDSTLSPAVRKEVESWENKRRKNKVEYAYSVNPDGTPIGAEIKGGRGSVRTPMSYHDTQDATFTHIHPRNEGMIGGTFSLQDLKNWANKKNKTERAAAKEGTYSISKGKNFDRDGFLKMANQADGEFTSNYRSLAKGIDAKYISGAIGYDDYAKQRAKAFNTALVKLHETYRQNQTKFGYEYTLEQV